MKLSIAKPNFTKWVLNDRVNPNRLLSPLSKPQVDSSSPSYISFVLMIKKCFLSVLVFSWLLKCYFVFSSSLFNTWRNNTGLPLYVGLGLVVNLELHPLDFSLNPAYTARFVDGTL